MYSWDAGAEIEWKREFSDTNLKLRKTLAMFQIQPECIFFDLEALSEAWLSKQSTVCPEHWCV